MDLPEEWEKKALIVVGIVVVIIVAYAFNPFKSEPNVTTNNESVNINPVTNMPFDQSSPNSTANTNETTNTTSELTMEQATNIAIQANPGYASGETSKETMVINGVTISVWRVTLTKSGSPSKTLYINAISGKIEKES
ncbi:MAG TPA: PepSY domain-containing protein [Methanobacteriaceae archaeon]|nr:PepSY domain-containing protein [Methanobacteriaceae archaeon]HNS25697.1 PepSY domain-containing protein [Methanobacteriaceae archaeon]